MSDSAGNRIESVRALGASSRELTEAIVRSEVGAEALTEATRLIERATALLTQYSRGAHSVPTAEDFSRPFRIFSPLTGDGHPFSLPLRWRIDDVGELSGRTTLGARLQGPPGMLHGGLMALIFDEILGASVEHVVRTSVTASLNVEYLRPVRLDQEIVVHARIESQSGRKTIAVGHIATATDPEAPVATARGVFVALTPERTAEHFSALRHADGSIPDLSHLAPGD